MTRCAKSDHQGLPVRQNLLYSAISNEMLPKETRHAPIELAVKGNPIKALRIVRTNARQSSCELRRAWGKKCKVAGRNNVYFGVARQPVRDPCDRRTITYSRSPAL
jgi:hypothetical protein